MNDVTMLIRCPQPECAKYNPQSATLNREKLKEMLDQGEVTVFGFMCGHNWKLSKAEMENTKAAMQKGVL